MSDWSEEELRDAVLAYREMQMRVASGLPFVKTAIYRDLAQRHGRTTGAFEYRMQNISFVLSLAGRDWIDGLKPYKNVGTNVIRQIEEILSELEGRAFSLDTIQRANDIDAIQRSSSTVPVGNRQPSRRDIQSTAYERDSAVVGWVLRSAEGRCELCEHDAPFHGTDSLPFLEVHHVKHLADGGSDTVSNTVALCPNCHKELHYGAEAKRKKEQLYLKIDRLIRE